LSWPHFCNGWVRRSEKTFKFYLHRSSKNDLNNRDSTQSVPNYLGYILINNLITFSRNVVFNSSAGISQERGATRTCNWLGLCNGPISFGNLHTWKMGSEYQTLSIL